MYVSGSRYAGPLDCLRSILHTEGPHGLFKGWSANYLRLGPQTTITFVAVEQLRHLTGLGSI